MHENELRRPKLIENELRGGAEMFENELRMVKDARKWTQKSPKMNSGGPEMLEMNSGGSEMLENEPQEA